MKPAHATPERRPRVTPALCAHANGIVGAAARPLLRATSAGALAAFVALTVACAPDPGKTMSNPTLAAQQDSTPLPLDPTRPVPMVGWWTNGHQMLHLADDGSFRFWSSMNRFDAPFQTGRWSRQNYMTLWLEPYAMRVPERTRGELERAGSEVHLRIEGFPAMVRFDEAPSSIEERLVGTWSGVGGTLRITSEGRYRAEAPSTGLQGAPIALAGHSGRWLVDGATLLLLPDSPSVPPVVLAIEPVGADSVRLRAGDGAYRRVGPP